MVSSLIIILLQQDYYHLDVVWSLDILPSEKIAFITYWNIRISSFGGLIISGKITYGTDPSKVAELLSESNAFYDAEMISGIMNAMLQHKKTSAVDRINAAEVNYVINQLKAVGVFIR